MQVLIGGKVEGADRFIPMDADPRTQAEPTAADPLSRWVSKFIDLLVVAAASHLVPPVGFFGGVTYLLIADGMQPGQSVGKRLLGLGVLGPHGRSCGVRESILRNGVLAIAYAVWYLFTGGGWLMAGLGWLVLVLVFGVEGVLLVGNPQGLRLGDEVGETRVVGMAAADRA
ncbi:MAG: RDD family protein [Nitrospirae bacterium]|nr:RDD family protein [Nitrospirota bacterium]